MRKALQGLQWVRTPRGLAGNVGGAGTAVKRPFLSSVAVGEGREAGQTEGAARGAAGFRGGWCNLQTLQIRLIEKWAAA